MFEYGRAVEFVREYEWLFSVHTNSFFLEPDIMARVKQEFSDHWSLEELADLAYGSKGNDGGVCRFMNRCIEFSVLTNEEVNEPSPTSSTRKPGVSDKKTYEINIMAPYIKNLADSHGIDHFVDVGAGLGYLDSALLDMPGNATIVAIERNKDNLKRLSSRIQEENLVTLSITDSTSIEEYKHSISLQCPYMMYSLHSCGSLSDHMIRLFLGDPRAKLLVAVGCCYNLITSKSFSFPLSLSLAGLKLNDFQKMAACQVPKKWLHQLEAVRLSEVKNYYRATLQLVLTKANAEHVDFKKIKFKSSPQCTFVEYCQRALQRLNNVEHVSDEIILQAEQQCSIHRKTLMMFWMLKACIGQVIEALILYDRFLFLKQSLPPASKVTIVALFSFIQSPRRYAIQAIK